MKKQKLFALALAGATIIGTLAAGMPVMATGMSPIVSGGEEPGDGHSNNTTVTLTVPEKEPEVSGEYFITVPATTNLDKDEATALEIKVQGYHMKNMVVVTAESQNWWRVVTEDKKNEIRYYLYEDKEGRTSATKWNFTADEVNANDGEGTTKEIYAKVDQYSMEDAKTGAYSDVITFRAESVDPTSGDNYKNEFWNAAESRGELYLSVDETSNGETTDYYLSYAYEEKNFKMYSAFRNNKDFYEGSNVFNEINNAFKIERQGKYLVISKGNMIAKVDTDELTYTVTGETDTDSLTVKNIAGGMGFSPRRVN